MVRQLNWIQPRWDSAATRGRENETSHTFCHTLQGKNTEGRGRGDTTQKPNINESPHSYRSTSVCERKRGRGGRERESTLYVSASTPSCFMPNENINDDTCEVRWSVSVTVWCVYVWMHCTRVYLCVSFVWEAACLQSDTFQLSIWPTKNALLDTSFNSCHFSSHTAITLAHTHTLTYVCKEPWAAALNCDVHTVYSIWGLCTGLIKTSNRMSQILM